MINPESFHGGRIVLHKGDCLEVLARLPEASVDAIIADSPYHFDTIVKRFGSDGAAPAQHGTDGVFKRASAGFMGKQWDGGDIAFRPETWAAAMRVLKPGGHLAAFAAPKCVHKMAISIELAGFEVRDRIINLFDPDPALVAFLESLSPAQADALFRLADQFGALGEAFWTFGSGFPKSHDISKAIDKVLGASFESSPASGVGFMGAEGPGGYNPTKNRLTRLGDATPEAEAWQGWGTALKPAYEPIVIARKPVALRNVALQVLSTGTGGINIDAARIGDEGGTQTDHGDAPGSTVHAYGDGLGARGGKIQSIEGLGRFPANLTHDGSDASVAGFPQNSGGSAVAQSGCGTGGIWPASTGKPAGPIHGYSGSAARFFYSSKADAHDRLGSGHPTVKPLDLMQWLARMLTPPGGTILDLFAGTGTTGEAAWREGFNAVLIEREVEHQADIARRMANVDSGPALRRAAGAKAKAARGGAPAADSDGFDLLSMAMAEPDRKDSI